MLEDINMKSYTFKLDFDMPQKSLKRLLKDMIWILVYAQRYKWLDVDHFEIMKTRHGYHVYIMALVSDRWQEKDYLIMQSMLGDDYKRIFFSYRRILQCAKDWNVLFGTKIDRKGEITNEKHNPDLSEWLFVQFWRRLERAGGRDYGWGDGKKGNTKENKGKHDKLQAIK